MSYIKADSSVISINQSYWEYIIRHLCDDGYLEGITLFRVVGQETPGIKMLNPMITPKGIEFLQNNSAMAKARDFFKNCKRDDTRIVNTTSQPAGGIFIPMKKATYSVVGGFLKGEFRRCFKNSEN